MCFFLSLCVIFWSVFFSLTTVFSPLRCNRLFGWDTWAQPTLEHRYISTNLLQLHSTYMLLALVNTQNICIVWMRLCACFLYDECVELVYVEWRVMYSVLCSVWGMNSDFDWCRRCFVLEVMCTMTCYIHGSVWSASDNVWFCVMYGVMY